MMAAIRGEFRKLLSIRSTYIIAGLAVALIALIAGYGNGFKAGDIGSSHLESSAYMALTIAATFVGLVAILAICHEYRYNTIYYTLTASNSRLKVLMAKLIATSAYALIMIVIAIGAALAFTSIGIAWSGKELGPQEFHWGTMAWQAAAYMVGSAWWGLMLGFLSRSLVFAIVVYFMLPTLEPLLTNLLKINPNYLPSASQERILSLSPVLGPPGPNDFSALASLGVFAIYVVVGLVVSGILFERRDAN